MCTPAATCTWNGECMNSSSRRQEMEKGRDSLRNEIVLLRDESRENRGANQGEKEERTEAAAESETARDEGSRCVLDAESVYLCVCLCRWACSSCSCLEAQEEYEVRQGRACWHS